MGPAAHVCSAAEFSQSAVPNTLPQVFLGQSVEDASMFLGFDVSGLQLPLLVVELILLGVTLLLIVIAKREFKARGELMQRVSRATDAITRQEYFASVIDTIQAAKKYVYASVTATPPTPEESAVVTMIVDSLSKAAARGVSVRYMVPHSPDRLPMARSYKMAGAELRFHPG